MTDHPPDRRGMFRAAIQGFLKARCDDKLDKLPPDDPKREALLAQFEYTAWIADAARRVTQIQAVTHSLKPIHPDARGTNLYCPPDNLGAHVEVGSHCLPANFSGDVVGNAAALDVYKFLKVEADGRPLLASMLDHDNDLIAALSDDAWQAEAWRAAFVSITAARGDVSSHTRGKQLYWLVGEDPQNDADYRVLAPLYASSLAQAVYEVIDHDRFSEEAKEARKARREDAFHPTGFHDYPNLAVQKLGGTKPQNISQLNSERRGVNYLLASLPPTWKSRSIRAPYDAESVFRRFGRQPEVRRLVGELLVFLASDPDPNVETRKLREAYEDKLIDELIVFAAEFQAILSPGWSSDPRCQLPMEERLWLDPRRGESDEAFSAEWTWMDWPDAVGKRFGNWLNGQLEGRLPVGDVEQRHWAHELGVDLEWRQQVKGGAS